MSQSAQSSPESVQAILARYRAIVEEPSALLNCATTPLPVCLWANPLKCDAPDLQRYLQDLGVSVETVDWMPGALRVPDWRSPGHTLAFTAGHYYVQEEIALSAVAALEPQPGERVLDLCAAPGGKAAQIALRLGATGMLVANQRQPARLASLTTTIARLGLMNVLTTQADGRTLNLPPHAFDRVLVDAPCSGEGNLRRRTQPRPWQPVYSDRIASVQKKLLRRALDLVKPGGVVVYSTCTFAPEENEAVLDAALGDRAHVEPFDIPGLRGQPGQTQWQGQTYRQDVMHARRYFPHFNNTGGFFVARLRRTDADLQLQGEVATTPPLTPLESAMDSPLEPICQQFAIAQTALPSTTCWQTGKRRSWLTSAASQPLPGQPPQTLGIPLASDTPLGLKPSTAFLQRFGTWAQQRVVELPDQLAAEKFVCGESQRLPLAVAAGYVHVRFGGFHLGCGHAVNGQLRSQLPKTLRWVAGSAE